MAKLTLLVLLIVLLGYHVHAISILYTRDDGTQVPLDMSIRLVDPSNENEFLVHVIDPAVKNMWSLKINDTYAQKQTSFRTARQLYKILTANNAFDVRQVTLSAYTLTISLYLNLFDEALVLLLSEVPQDAIKKLELIIQDLSKQIKNIGNPITFVPSFIMTRQNSTGSTHVGSVTLPVSGKWLITAQCKPPTASYNGYSHAFWLQRADGTIPGGQENIYFPDGNGRYAASMSVTRFIEAPVNEAISLHFKPHQYLLDSYGSITLSSCSIVAQKAMGS